MSTTPTRRHLIQGVSFLLGLTLNVMILALIARTGASPPQVATIMPLVLPVDLSQLVLPDRAEPLVRKPPAPGRAMARPRHKADAAASASPPSPSPPPPSPSPLLAEPASPAGPAALGGSDAATRAGVSAALRGLTGCSMISGPDDEAMHDRCHAAFTKADTAGLAIDSVPGEKRAAYDVSAMQAEHVRMGTVDTLKPETAGHSMVRDHGVSINVHYKCLMKFGAGAVPKMHCPGIM